MEEFHRIRRLPPYVFEQVNRAKAAARNAGADIIDLGMGNPDLPTPAHVIEKLKDTIGKPRTDRYSSSRGHSRAAPRPGRLLRAPLRREAQSRDPGRHHARLQGRLRQRGAGDHGARRRDPGAQSELSDPRLRLPDGGRRDPLGAVGADAGILPDARARHHPFDPEADRGRGLLSVQPDRLCRRSRFLQGPRRRSRSSTTSSCCPISPMRKSISTTSRRRRCCRCRARWISRSSSPRCRRPIRCRAGASALRSATSASSRALARVKSYLDYGAFTPIQVAATAALNGPDDCIREMRETYKRRRDVLVESFGRAGWDDPAAARLDVRLGADRRSRSGRSAASNSPRCWSRRPRSRSRPASASANTARASCASRWSRTSSASARPPATSAAFLKPPRKSCTTSSRLPSGAKAVGPRPPD